MDNVHCRLNQSQSNSRDCAQSQDSVTCGIDSFQSQTTSGIPQQVADTVESVKGERVGDKDLSSKFRSDGNGCER